jgi:mono/diheme cytochrome c family protein
MVFGYNACGPGFTTATHENQVSLIASSTAQCDSLLKQTYQTTYFPLLSTSCNACHSNSQGSTNLDLSFATFNLKGKTLIDRQASAPHSGNNLSLGPQIASLQSSWSHGLMAQQNCLATLSSQAFGSLFLIAKPIPGIDATINAPDKFITLEWDLDSEVLNSQKNLYHMIFKIDVRYAIYNSAPVGFEFHNPSLRLKTAGSEARQITGLHLNLDGYIQNGLTTYQDASVPVASTSDTALFPNAADAIIAYAGSSSTTLVGFNFDSVQRGSNIGLQPGSTPPPITFSLLNSNSAIYSVFTNNCVSCHNSGSANGNLDITNYQSVAGKASLIQSRMSSNTKPMPPSGIILQTQRDLIFNWISKNMPP